MSKPTRTLPAGQLTLPGQSHTAEGPHDQTGMYVMHHALRRDFLAFVAAVQNTPVSERQVWEALSQRWQKAAEMLHHHHSVEDASLWPVLQRHAEEAAAEEDLQVLEDMEAEHAILLRVHAELPERRSLEGHLGLVGEVGIRLAGPEREQLLEPVHLRGDLGVAGPLGRGAGAELAGERCQGAVPAAHLVGEVVGVDLVAAQLEPVAVVPGEEHARSLAWAEAGFEHAAYAGEVGVQRAVRTAGWVRTPDEPDQHVRGYVAAQPQRQRRQHRAWLAGAELDGSVVLAEHHLTRTEDAHPHAETVTGPRPKWP